MTNTINVKVLPILAAYNDSISPRQRTVLKQFDNEEEMKNDTKTNSMKGEVFVLRTPDNDHLDDSLAYYATAFEAEEHLKVIAFSHSSEPTDTEGHSYICQHCGADYYVFGEEAPTCSVEKVAI